ncbi:hypothetical protein DDZ13_06530 [Coraliomargarita sinensis]|uniref:Uncharacterized protein n=1 Tax=Coraliomargarita sinensis TaxID=2174842 RepID=A0A317ZGV7_9BACT|nr:hypothetical protein [Coraliomargarita sinensis]PXA04816.1 hypothetical protein DDZ13_06530 [Coraliomargarita sinensis]
MRAPTRPIRDEALAGQFARKCFGKFGMARKKNVRIPSCPKRSFTVYEIGTCSQIGEFVMKGDSSHDFAEAFDRAGFPMDARDPLFIRDDFNYCRKLAEAEQAEQVEMAL